MGACEGGEGRDGSRGSGGGGEESVAFWLRFPGGSGRVEARAGARCFRPLLNFHRTRCLPMGGRKHGPRGRCRVGAVARCGRRAAPV